MGTLPVLIFYRQLFAVAPSLRPMFGHDIEAQAAKFLDMLATLISHLERTSLMEAELKLMGERHAGYGVEAQHYTIVGEAFFGMLTETLRGDFTPPVQEAWAALYSRVAEAMQAGASQRPSLPHAPC